MIDNRPPFKSKITGVAAAAPPNAQHASYTLVTDRRGGSYVEYVILLAVIVLGSIGALRLLRGAIADQIERESRAFLSMTALEGSALSSNVDRGEADSEVCGGLSDCALHYGKDVLRSLGSATFETGSALETIASSAWHTVKARGSEVLDGMRTNAKYVQQAQEWLEHRADLRKSMGEAAGRALVDKGEGIPIVEQGVKTYVWMGKQANQVDAAIEKFGIRALGGVASIVANPVDAALGLATMAEHTSLFGPTNPLRIAHGLYNAATTDATVAGELKRALNPIEAAKDDRTFWVQTGRAFVKPCTDAWNHCNYTESVTCGALEVGSFFVGAGEAKAARAGSAVVQLGEGVKALKGAEVANAAVKLGGEAKFAEGAKAANGAIKLGVEGEVLQAGKTAEGAGLADTVTDTAGAADKAAAVAGAARGGAGLLPPGDPLIDNNVFTRLIQGDSEALTFAGRRSGLLSVTDTVAQEATVRHGAQVVEETIARLGINRISDPSAAVVNARMQALGITSPGRYNDISILVAAEQNGVGLVTADRGLFSAALRARLPDLQFRIFDHSAASRVAAYQRMRALVGQQRPGISAHIFTGSGVGR